jgi:hypothetical protein
MFCARCCTLLPVWSRQAVHVFEYFEQSEIWVGAIKQGTVFGLALVCGFWACNERRMGLKGDGMKSQTQVST